VRRASHPRRGRIVRASEAVAGVVEIVLTDPKAREFLRKADPILARLIDAQPGFQPRAVEHVALSWERLST
jgi:hypothetical protein